MSGTVNHLLPHLHPETQPTLRQACSIPAEPERILWAGGLNWSTGALSCPHKSNSLEAKSLEHSGSMFMSHVMYLPHKRGDPGLLTGDPITAAVADVVG